MKTLTDLIGFLVEAEGEVQSCDLKLQLFVFLVALWHDLDSYIIHADIPMYDPLAVKLVN